jgi:Raf kinase inhibitor-like YbhB/YbcL family protein
MPFELRSPSFQDGGTIPAKYTCDGEDVSPALAWANPPPGTRAFALIMDDPDAPVGTWVHWVVYDVPGGVTGLPEGVNPGERLPDGGTQGRNSWGRLAYGGPCPPGGMHRYVFTLYALRAPLGLAPGATKEQVLQALEGRVLARATLMGRYGR